MVKALDLSSNGRVVRVGSNPTPGKNSPFNGRVVTSRLYMQRTEYCIHDSIQGLRIFYIHLLQILCMPVAFSLAFP